MPALESFEELLKHIDPSLESTSLGIKARNYVNICIL